MRYFDISEFDCPCCGKNEMNKMFLQQLDEARHISGVPYVINSGYRCPKHNKEVGSTSNNHTEGMAADIRATSNYERGRILKGLYKAGFTRIGIGETFIHVDSMNKVESCWRY
jgi:hypothetical protein